LAAYQQAWKRIQFPYSLRGAELILKPGDGSSYKEKKSMKAQAALR
jgi:hypothetical protein